MSSRPPISATYRLQFNKDFTFRAATELLGYLSDLGITHIYASPILRSRPGSTHGYDVIDATRSNPELGSQADFNLFCEQLRQRNMGLLLDIVPNHMAATTENAWWMDVLEYGPASVYASYFDIDWHPPSRALEGKVLLPFFGRPFAEVLENRELALRFIEGKFFVQYFEWLLPVAPRSYPQILERRLEALKNNLGAHSAAFQEYAGIAAAAATVSARHSSSAAAAAHMGEMRLQFEQLTERLRQLALKNSDVQTFINQTLQDFAGIPGHPASFSLLEQLLADQFYLLVYWQNLNQEINYRRFFTITDLVGMRVEDPLVFEATHSLILRMMEEDAISALRVDHLDGLHDPVGYLNRLNERVAASAGPKESPVYVEKILSPGESLRADWPVAGTTGYDFLNALNWLFVHSDGARALERIYFDFLDRTVDYEDLLYQKKKLVMGTLFAAELRSLGHQLALLASQDRYARDLPLMELTQALNETTAGLSAYRTYIRNLEVSPEDRAVIELAVAKAQGIRPELHLLAFPFIRDVLLLHNPPHLLPGQRESRLAFVMRWQQFTGPIMVKSFEDSLLYVYNPLISLNEVGGDPRPSAASPNYFHRLIEARSRKWPYSLNATTTHDTKRSEDARARLNVLSEIPEEWETRLRSWRELNARYKTDVHGQMVPDPNEEIFLYQTLLSMWPFAADERATVLERLQAYAVKATREAMVHTRWTLPNLAHEQALEQFIAQILAAGDDNRFLRDFTAFHERIAYSAMLNGLSQTLLKIISPGVPDFYQGSELWDFRLVDPDNRRPVDFSKRQAALAGMRTAQPSLCICVARDLAQQWRDGRIKLYVIWRALNYRRQNAELFSRGEFVSLAASGARQGHISAYCRRRGEQLALVVLPRWFAAVPPSASRPSADDFWAGTEISLPDSSSTRWRNIFTGEDLCASPTASARQSLPIAELFCNFPVAMLETSTASG
jgi:(1->4)-alpha-D-glucan 1-alpha-D-glucosylmutase